MNKHGHNRREFLGLTGAGVAGLAGGSLLGTTVFAETQSADADPRHADLVVFNATIYTVDYEVFPPCLDNYTASGLSAAAYGLDWLGIGDQAGGAYVPGNPMIPNSGNPRILLTSFTVSTPVCNRIC